LQWNEGRQKATTRPNRKHTMAAASHTTLLIAAARVENENARYSIGIARSISTNRPAEAQSIN
jgi:hypothetical protein